jgi:hypothetical protein
MTPKPCAPSQYSTTRCPYCDRPYLIITRSYQTLVTIIHTPPCPITDAQDTTIKKTILENRKTTGVGE